MSERSPAGPAAVPSGLRELNLEIGEAETRRDGGFLAGVLHDRLIFRRANGKVVGKDEYLQYLPNRTPGRTSSEILAVEERGDSAVVTVLVTVEGTPGGSFHNTRVFVREDGRWQLLTWTNTRVGLGVATLHHVSLPVTNLERARAFYRDVLGLREMERPPFDFPGAWFRVGDQQQLHLIVHDRSTLRGAKGVDSRDIHCALRVTSYRRALESLQERGYREDAPEDDPMRMKVDAKATAGFPQIYILDPDRNVIEINAERLDM